MDQISVAPPPLPPKTRRSPPEATVTVLSSSSSDDVFTVYSAQQENNQTTSSASHVVKIRINPNSPNSSLNSLSDNDDSNVICDVAPCSIRISVNNPEMIQNSTMVDSDRSNSAYFFYNTFNCAVMSSGQVSPNSDTLDSGTCSDLDGTPPPLPKKKSNSSGVSVTLIQHKRASSLTSSADSDDNESSISCDSLNSGKISPIINNENNNNKNNTILPQTLLQDIRQRNNNMKLTTSVSDTLVKSYQERKDEEIKESMMTIRENSLMYESDMFYNFHLNEHIQDESPAPVKEVAEDESFAGYKDLLGNNGASTIRSAKGTVRGVKNRVRAGIATFLQINSDTKLFVLKMFYDPVVEIVSVKGTVRGLKNRVKLNVNSYAELNLYAKNYKEKELGKVVVYTTTMGILRETYQACMNVKRIMRTLLVKYEERDVFMNSEYQNEIRDRMRCDQILVPQVFVDGQHVGDAETIERLNECGELRRILKPFKSMDVCTTCKVCGGFRLLPCQVCNGSKKSVHRNHFTAEFVALKCMNCDEVGLVKCNAC